MPTKREDYNGYMRKYMLARYHRRRAEIVQRLGGKCVKCGSIELLEIDHVDPKSKVHDFGKRLAGLSAAKLEEEVKKAQLLCDPCHNLKSMGEKGHQPARGQHGTISSYRYCKCELCRAASKAYHQEHRRKKAARVAQRQEAHGSEP